MQNIFPRSYVVWDLETTGFSPTDDRIVEVAVAIVRDGNVVEEWSALINPDVEINPGAQEVHGISKEMCEKEGKPEREVIARLFQNLLDCEAHITHNGTRFDLLFLERCIVRLQQENRSEYPIFTNEIRNKHIDTAALYKASMLDLVKGWTEPWPTFFRRVLEMRVKDLKYNVGVCCDTLGISREGVQQHRALADVLLTNEIYKRLVYNGATKAPAVLETP